MTTTELDTVEARTAKDKRRIQSRHAWTARGLLLPAFIFLILLTQIPFLVTIGFSLMEWNLLYPANRGFTGLDNYQTALSSGALWPSIVATVLITAFSVVLSLSVLVSSVRNFMMITKKRKNKNNMKKKKRKEDFPWVMGFLRYSHQTPNEKDEKFIAGNLPSDELGGLMLSVVFGKPKTPRADGQAGGPEERQASKPSSKLLTP